jgi:hypothetical protein
VHTVLTRLAAFEECRKGLFEVYLGSPNEIATLSMLSLTRVHVSDVLWWMDTLPRMNQMMLRFHMTSTAQVIPPCL